MAKFHLNGKGEPGPCRATQGNCPFGGDEAHYSSKEEAQQAYERTQGQDSLAGVSKSPVKLPKALTHDRLTGKRIGTPEREAFYRNLLTHRTGVELDAMAKELAAAARSVPYSTPAEDKDRLASEALARLSPLALAMADQHDTDGEGWEVPAFKRLTAASTAAYNVARYKMLQTRRLAAKPIAPYSPAERAAIRDALAHLDFSRGVLSGQGETPKAAVERVALGVHQAVAEGWSQEAQAKFHKSYAINQLEKQHGVSRSSAYSRLLGAINDEDEFEAVVTEPEVRRFLSDGIKGKRLFQNSNLAFDRLVVGEAFRRLGPARAGRLLNEVNGQSMSIPRFYGEIEALEPR